MLRRLTRPLCVLCDARAPAARLLSLSARPSARLGVVGVVGVRVRFAPARSLHVTAQPPTVDPLDDDYEIDPALAHAVLILTEPAMAIARAQKKARDPSLALRVSVESGGCHGYQYKMEVTTERQPDDYLFNPSAFDPDIKVLVDSSSLPLLEGSTIDYATELIGSSFRITGNPHASDKGGCGCGVSWELKE